MTSSQKPLLPGIILIILGIVFLLPRFLDIRMVHLWPLFVLGAGIAFFVAAFSSRSNYGMLMPASILTVFGLMFLYSSIEGWHAMRSLWPLFLVGPGLGFVLMYLFGKREQGLLVPGGILLGLGVFFLLGTTEYDYLWPLLLIAVGALLLFSSRGKQKDS